MTNSVIRKLRNAGGGGNEEPVIYRTLFVKILHH